MTACLTAQEVALDDEVFASEALCRRALATDYPDFLDRLSTVPKTPESCFEFLYALPHDRKQMQALRRLEAEAARAGIDTPYAVEHFVVLQAYLAALPRLRSLPVDDSVKQQFCATCRLLASPLQTRENRLAHDSDAFAELAQIVTLRRFHAGQLSFDIMNMPRAWLLKVHPFELGSLTLEIMVGIGGLGPVVMPHINYWRPNPLFILRREQEHALWRIAKSLERQRHVRGLAASSWLYCQEVGESFPHLAWVRNFFVNRGAYIVDAGPALVDAGFLVGSEKRRRLYADGKFRPRETLVLWRRRDMLTWASSCTGPNEAARPRSVSPSSVRATPPRCPTNNITDHRRKLQNGRATLIDCKRLLFYNPRHYVVAILFLPALFFAILAGALWTAAAGVPVFIFIICVMWMFQYFCLQ